MREIKDIKKSFDLEIAKVKSEDELGRLKIKYLGRKGEVAKLMKSLSSFGVIEKKRVGKEANELKKEVEKKITETRLRFGKSEISNDKVDITAPGSFFPVGHLHPVTKMYREIFKIFTSMGYEIASGPEVESDWYNFQALNFPKDHPARDTQDTLYIDDERLLRTQTSPMQIRYMEKNDPPLRVIVYGKTYRRDSDITHTPMFHQLEGLLVDKDVTLADLKGTLELFVKKLFSEDREIRFRPHFFPFTEPSAEVDVSCGICKGEGCRSCKHTGWLEILGAGMVHPNVLKNGGVDPKKYQGFAFGVGIERLAMLKYNIDDLRLFYDGDLRFLEQF